MGVYRALGARLGMYAEYFSYGNPGMHQTYVFGVNSAGPYSAPPIPALDGGHLGRARLGSLPPARADH